MKFWVTRDKYSGEHRVWIWKSNIKPTKTEEEGVITYTIPGAIEARKTADMVIEEFEMLFGFLPETGSCGKYSFPKLRKI